MAGVKKPTGEVGFFTFPLRIVTLIVMKQSTSNLHSIRCIYPVFKSLWSRYHQPVSSVYC